MKIINFFIIAFLIFVVMTLVGCVVVKLQEKKCSLKFGAIGTTKDIEDCGSRHDGYRNCEEVLK